MTEFHATSSLTALQLLLMKESPWITEDWRKQNVLVSQYTQTMLTHLNCSQVQEAGFIFQISLLFKD